MSSPRLKLNDFFTGVQHKALKQIEFAIGDRDEALDLLQDAMIRLAKNYSMEEEDWPKLFQRILQNLIRDWHRRKKVRGILVWWNQTSAESENVEHAVGSEMEYKPSKSGHNTPERQHQNKQATEEVVKALQELPFRQQQAFTLRAWWGHDVKETAFAMRCSEGSVKTHYSRAVSRLRELLGEHEL